MARLFLAGRFSSLERSPLHCESLPRRPCLCGAAATPRYSIGRAAYRTSAPLPGCCIRAPRSRPSALSSFQAALRLSRSACRQSVQRCRMLRTPTTGMIYYSQAFKRSTQFVPAQHLLNIVNLRWDVHKARNCMLSPKDPGEQSIQFGHKVFHICCTCQVRKQSFSGVTRRIHGIFQRIGRHCESRGLGVKIPFSILLTRFSRPARAFPIL